MKSLKEVAGYVVVISLPIVILVLWMLITFGLDGKGPFAHWIYVFLIAPIQKPPGEDIFVGIILGLGVIAWLFFGLPALFGAAFSGGDQETWDVTKHGRDSYTIQKK